MACKVVPDFASLSFSVIPLALWHKPFNTLAPTQRLLLPEVFWIDKCLHFDHSLNGRFSERLFWLCCVKYVTLCYPIIHHLFINSIDIKCLHVSSPNAILFFHFIYSNLWLYFIWLHMDYIYKWTADPVKSKEAHVFCSPLYYFWYVTGNQKIFVE